MATLGSECLLHHREYSRLKRLHSNALKTFNANVYNMHCILAG